MMLSKKESNSKKEWKIACDLYCGATSTIAADAFEAVGLRASMINSHPDGHFPAGDPEPTTENLLRLGAYIKATGAEAGFGFDGDGDRMMAVDETGTPISGDRLLAAYAGYVVERERRWYRRYARRRLDVPRGYGRSCRR